MADLFKFIGGLVDKRDPRLLEPGDLLTAIGVEYRPGTDEVFTTGMRAHAGTFGSDGLTSLLFAQYEGGSDKLVAFTGSTEYEATAATSGMSGSQGQLYGSPISLASVPAHIIGKMFNDILFVAPGVGLNIVLPDTSNIVRRQNLIRRADGTWLLAGLVSPAEPPDIGTPSTSAATRHNPTAGSGTWLKTAKAYDTATGSDDTYSRTFVGGSGASKSQIWTFGVLTASGSVYKLKVLHATGTSTVPAYSGKDLGAGGTDRDPLVSNLLIEYTLNNGGAWTELSNKTVPYSSQWSEISIPNASYGSGDIQVRVTATKTSGSGIPSFFINTIKITSGGDPVDIVNGFRYICTEWDDDRKKESGWSRESEVVPATTAATSIAVTMPSQVQNNRATHWRIYRSVDGAAKDEYDKYGLIAEIPIAASAVLIDVFDKPITEVARPTLPALPLGQGDDIAFFNRFEAAPAYKSIAFYKGSLFGIPIDDPDNVYYSPPFDPESRPSIYSVPARSPKDESPEALLALDEVLLIFYQSWIRSQRGVALVVNGLFDVTPFTDVSTVRGIVGPDALDSIVLGEEDSQHWAVCADAEGIYITNGFAVKSWSDNIDWPVKVAPAYLGKTVIRNNQFKRRAEVYYVPVGGSTLSRRLDFYYGTLRADGQPRITGPHYINARGIAYGRISGQEERFTGSSAGVVYREDSGTSDASLSYDSSGTVPRTLKTGDLPITDLGGEGFVQHTILRSKYGSYATVNETVFLKYSTGEVMQLTHSEDPGAPEPFGVFAGAETLQYQFSDDSVSSRTPILGVVAETEVQGNKLSALRASLGASAGTSNLPK